MSDKFDVYQAVTDEIVKALESGTVPWRKPWRTVGGDVPRNLISGKPYRGVNQLLLSLSDYASPYWLTFKQAQAKGGKVRKGERSTLVVFWKMLPVADPDAKNGVKTMPLLRYYRIFNVEQCDGIEAPEPSEVPDFDPIEEADSIIDGYDVRISYGGQSACYVPAFDEIRMPVREAFDSPAAFYRVMFHEMTHSTGHEDRLNREGIVKFDRFGSERYSREELIAELGAAMLATLAGIDTSETIPPSASYIASWLKALADDPKMVVQAAGKAQRAADFILGAGAEHEAQTRELVAA